MFENAVKICADGFLYNMVRIIVGTLIEIAFDRMSVDELQALFENPDRKLAGPTAPAEGLYLNKINY